MVLQPYNIPVTGYDSSVMGQPIKQGDWFALCMPFHGYVLLSGGKSVRTSSTQILGDETWTIDWRGNFTGTYATMIGLEMPKYNNDYLSGGDSVRTNTTNYNLDEQWQLISVTWGSSRPITYGSFVAVQMVAPKWSGLLLSGGSSMRTTTKDINLDEIWQILKVAS